MKKNFIFEKQNKLGLLLLFLITICSFNLTSQIKSKVKINWNIENSLRFWENHPEQNRKYSRNKTDVFRKNHFELNKNSTDPHKKEKKGDSKKQDDEKKKQEEEELKRKEEERKRREEEERIRREMEKNKEKALEEKKRAEAEISKLKDEKAEAIRKKEEAEREERRRKDRQEDLQFVLGQVKQNENEMAISNMKNIIGEVKQTLKVSNKMHLFFESLKIHEKKQKELKDELHQKALNIKNSEMQIIELSNNINLKYKTELKSLFGKISSLERTTKSIFERIGKIEAIKILKETDEEESSLNPDNIMKNILLDDCKGRNSCDVCVANLGCVWCGISGKCTPGNIDGPLDQSCSMSFSHGKCPMKKCEDFSDCGKCVERKMCGWCKENKMCLDVEEYNREKGKCSQGIIIKNNIKGKKGNYVC